MASFALRPAGPECSNPEARNNGRPPFVIADENAKDGYRVNLGCVEGLDPLALEISIIDGKALPVIEEPD